MNTNTEVELKRCPRCEKPLPLSEFGLCNARPDKKNLYCKPCIRQKITLSRQALREYHASRQQHRLEPQPKKESLPSARRLARMMRKLSPEDRVREAIRRGAHTQKEIVRETKLLKDEVCDALANLLLWSKTVRTRMVRHQRMYFINEDGSIQREPVRPPMPRSYGVSTIYDCEEVDVRGMSTRYVHKVA